MYLFIFESLGTSELLLIGLVALIFLGPRRLPEMARKAGKIMNELRGTANEFKSTWEREVNLDAEMNALDLNSIESESENSIARSKPLDAPSDAQLHAPAIRSIDKESFDTMAAGNDVIEIPAEVQDQPDSPAESPVEIDVLSDKRHWL